MKNKDVYIHCLYKTIYDKVNSLKEFVRLIKSGLNYEYVWKNFKDKDFLKLGISQETSHEIIKNRSLINVNNEKKLLENMGIQIILINNSKYPKILKEISVAPPVLYCKGNIDILNSECIAIVGSRTNTNYADNVLSGLMPTLLKYNNTIISGMALGVDKLAHEKCIDLNGETIAVLGCGIDIVYPKNNISLYNKILDSGGLIVSEFPPGTNPKKHFFPRRNRIISGLCNMCFIIEAKLKSGSLITANFAFEQNKDVFAVPGQINKKESLGCNSLIENNKAYIYCGIDSFINHMKLNKPKYIQQKLI